MQSVGIEYSILKVTDLRFQLSRFLALMQNYQISLNATETALHSQGSAVSENTKFMQSLEARIQKMKTAWDTLSLSVGNALISDSIVVLTSLMTGLGSALTKTVDTFGALPVIFGVIASGVYLLNASFKAFIINLFGITTSASAASGALSRMTVVLGAVKIGLRALLVSSLVGVAFAGLGFILEKVIGHFSNASEVMDDTGTSLDKLKDKTGSLKELQELSNEYDNLTKKTILNTEEKIRLASVESDLAAKHGITMSTVEDQTVAVKENTLAIGDRIKALKEEAAIEQQKALDEYKANKTAINSEIESQQAKKNSAQAEIDSLSKMQEQLESSIANKQTIKNDKGQLGNFAPYQLEVNPSDYDTSGLDVISESIAQAILDAKDKFDSAGTEFDKAVSKREQAFKAQFSAYADTIEAGGTEVKASTRVLADGFASIMATAKTDDLDILAKYKNEVFSIFQNTKVNSMDDAVASLERFAGSAKLTKDQFNILQTAISQLNFQGVNDGADGAADSLSDAEDKILTLSEAMDILDDVVGGSTSQMDAFSKSVANGKSEIDLINTAQGEMADKGYLSVETLAKLTETFGDFTSVVGLGKDAIVAYMRKKEQERVSSINSEIEKTKNLIQNATDRIATMEAEMRAIDKLRNAYGALVNSGEMTDLEAERRLGTIAKDKSDSIGLTAEKQTLAGLQAKLGLLNYISADYSATAAETGSSKDKEKTSKDKTKSEKDKDLAEFKDATEQRINAINAEADAQTKLNALYKEKSSGYESDKNYPAAIEQTTNLLKGQKLETTKLQQANTKLIAARDEVQAKAKQYSMISWIDANGEATTSFTNLYNSMKSKTAQEALQKQFDQFQMYTKAIRENKTAITDNIAAQKESQKTLDNQKLENTNVWLDKMSKSYEKIQDKVDDSKDVQSLLNEDSADYRSELKKQIDLYREKLAAVEKDTESIKARIKQSENAKTADKLTTEQLEALNAQLKANNDTWYDTSLAIREATRAAIDFSSKALSSLFDTLKSSIGPDSLLDLSEFSDSIDSIIATLDEADKKYLTNVSFVDTTSSTRSDLSDYASKVKDIATQVKSALNFYQDMDNVSFSNLSSLSAQINSQVALISSLKTKLDEVNNTVRDTELRYSKEEAALSELIKTREKYYDSQIEAQQTVLDNLDDQIEKEDRLKELQDINDELNKVKNDKRFEYVTESGELILTYDKARVDELEKQKDDLVKQYEREDVKSAIQNEIDRLQKAKDSEVEILNANLEKTKAIHQADLEALKLYQSSLSSLYDQTVTDTQNKLDQFQAAIQQGLEDGTITASEATTLLEGVVNNWQSLSLSNWDTYINQVISKLEKLKQLYAEMANAANAAMSQSSPSSSSSNPYVDPNSPNYYVLSPEEIAKMQAEQDKVISTPIMEQLQEAVKGKHWDGTQWVYHTGGTAGKEPLKSNEVPAILEDGELVLTKNHQDILKNMFSRSRDIVGSVMSNLTGAMSGITFNKSTPAVAGGPSYTFTGPITVKADNPTEFLTGLEHLITSQRR